MTNKLGNWLRGHSFTLAIVVGGAASVTYASTLTENAPASAQAKPAPVAPSATPKPATPVAPVKDTVQDTVQIALILDTSGSMNGLIDQARSQLWKMVDQLGRMTRVVDGKVRGVKIELALYEYGNSKIPARKGHIRQVIGFSTDLDRVSEQLYSLVTNGGEEYAGQAIQTAVTDLAWSKDPAAMKFVYLAGNETFVQGDVSADTAMAAAAKWGIDVQLIYCGDQEPSWSQAAKLAKSDLLTIDQNRVAQHIAAPQDDEIVRLGSQLNDTYLAYGAHGQAAVARQNYADTNSVNESKWVAVERANFKSSASYDNYSWDLVDALKNDRGALSKIPDSELPTNMQGKSIEEKQAIIHANAARRTQLQSQIAKLEIERTAYIEAERAKAGTTSEQSLATELMKSAKKVANARGYKF